MYRDNNSFYRKILLIIVQAANSGHSMIYASKIDYGGYNHGYDPSEMYKVGEPNVVVDDATIRFLKEDGYTLESVTSNFMTSIMISW